jgi:hypothetical protein
MKTKYFKTPIPKEHLFSLLDRICKIEDSKYVLNYCSYKSGMFNDLIKPFFLLCSPYYLQNKQNYVSREITYKSFLTIVRHICKTNNIVYSHHIKYNKSEYEILYLINIPSFHETSSRIVVCQENEVRSEIQPASEYLTNTSP